MSDNDLRYYLFKFLNYNISSVPATASGYMTENFWLDFCRDEGLNLTETKVRNFVNYYNIAIDLYFQSLGTTITAIKRFSNVYLETTSQSALISAFGAIDVTISISNATSPIIFTMPNNNQKTLYYDPTVVIITPSQDYSYAQLFYDGFTLDTMQSENINNLKMRTGETSWWEYNSTKNRIEIKGTGSSIGANVMRKKTNTANFTPFEDVMNNTCSTIIFDESITKLTSGATLYSGESNTGSICTINKIVFKHSNNDPITLTSYILAPKTAPSTKPVFDIYTDNDTVKNYNYSKNITVNIHPLSEWED